MGEVSRLEGPDAGGRANCPPGLLRRWSGSGAWRRARLATAATFANHARVALNNFTALSTRANQIKQLRQTILNMAVRGKLVPQDPKDQPASELLKQAKKSKQRLLVERSISRDSGPEYSTSATEQFAPAHWSWAYLDDIALVQGGKRLPAGATFSKEPTGHIYIRVTDMKGGTISTSNLKYIRNLSKAGSRNTRSTLMICISQLLGRSVKWARFPTF
jgi:hypothetical protein